MKLALGLMSGTSLDGIDAALIRTDGQRVAERGAWLTLPYAPDFRECLRSAVYGQGDMAALERELTLQHAEAVAALLRAAHLNPQDVEVIGFHGQTVAHRPNEGITVQLGDGALLAEKTGISVVCDFRRRDVAAGGQGAPLVPLYHAALVQEMELPLAVLNLGGVANVTWIGRCEEEAEDSLLALDIVAFDTGPGNVLLNEWARLRRNMPMDAGGALALAGTADASVLRQLLAEEYFRLTPPKSLDRNHFSLAALSALSAEDGAATLTEFTASAVAAGARFFPSAAQAWYVTGGGRHNPALMQALRRLLGSVIPVETLGWEGDALEAQAFAFLAVRSLQRLPLSLPTTTGVRRAITGGAFYPA